MTVVHVSIACAGDYVSRREPVREEHIDRLRRLRAAGILVAGGPAPDGRSVDLFYRVPHRDALRSIVEEDPYEQGLRRVLNLGHTVGHALEQATGYGVLTHGEAVAFGMLAALKISVTRGLASAQFEKSTRWILAACGLPFQVPQVPREQLVQAMSLDKKRAGAGISFVLPIAPGDVRIVDDVTEDEIIAAFESI